MSATPSEGDFERRPEYLFIGGPFDGQRHRVDHSSVTQIVPDADGRGDTRYELEFWRSGSGSIGVFVAPGVDVMEQLTKHYHPGEAVTGHLRPGAVLIEIADSMEVFERGDHMKPVTVILPRREP